MRLLESRLRKIIREELQSAVAQLAPEIDDETSDLEEPHYELPKGEWVLLEPGDPIRDMVQKDLYDLVNQTYGDIGGHVKVQGSGDMSRYPIWVVIDHDEDPELDVGIFGKAQSGTKSGGVGHDGSGKSRALYKTTSADIRSGGSIAGVGNWWGEVSGSPAYALLKRGAPAVENEDMVRALMPGKKIVWHGEHPDPDADPMFKSVKGWYTKDFGDSAHTKIIIGNPDI
tara:strand:+ start:27 stop:710 length:684 start_codon:yes stop_codon:yes gene_type:complete